MITDRLKMVLELVAMIQAAITGSASRLTRDVNFQTWHEQITYWHSLTRVGCIYGMAFGVINILFALPISGAICSSQLKRVGAVFTASALCQHALRWLPPPGGPSAMENYLASRRPNSMQRTALRAAADAERSEEHGRERG